MSEHCICRSRRPRCGEQDPDCPVHGDQPAKSCPDPASAPLAFHGTTAEAWHLIRHAGLAPRCQAHRDEARCLPPEEAALFFCPSAELAAPWGEVVVAFPWPGDAAEDTYGDTILTASGTAMRTSWFSRRHVAAQHLALVPR